MTCTAKSNATRRALHLAWSLRTCERRRAVRVRQLPCAHTHDPQTLMQVVQELGVVSLPFLGFLHEFAEGVSCRGGPRGERM